MSFYDWSSAPGATVYEVETNRKLDRAVSVDTTAGVVVRHEYPLRIEIGEVASFTERYESIHPIYGGRALPMLFHCYGRKA